jgi:hypothetical protein
MKVAGICSKRQFRFRHVTKKPEPASENACCAPTNTLPSATDLLIVNSLSYMLDPSQFAPIEGRRGAGPITSADHVTIDAIKIATHNFRRLNDCILGFHPEWQAPDVCEEGCLEEILSLPSEADSDEPSRLLPSDLQLLQSLRTRR